jgi:plastocyanin
VPKLLLLLVVIAAVFAGPAIAATKTTKLQDDFFVKGKLTIKKGDTVVWSWKTDDEHTVTEIHGRWGSTDPKTKGTVKHKFKKRGKFTVYCLVHPTIMRQKVIVK